MRYRLAVLCLFIAPASHAQFAVIDVASVAQLVQQAATLTRQLQQAEAQVAQARTLYQSLTGPRGMEQLLNGSVRNYLPADWQQLMLSVQSAASYSALNADIRAAVSANSVLSATQVAWLSPTAQTQLTAARNNVALLQGLAQEALANSSNRFAAIQQLIQAIPSAQDQKGILDLQARIGAEQGMLQNEQTKLETLRWVVAAQTEAIRQREAELAIAGHGDFAARFEPTPEDQSATTMHSGFFQTFWTWLLQELSTYIAANTARIASAIEPAVVTCAVLYVMAWGYLQLAGRIEEPLVTGVQRIVRLAVVLGVSLHLWLYNDVIVDTFYRAPAQFASSIVGSADPVVTIDSIWSQGGAAADNLFKQSDSGMMAFINHYIMAAVVWLLVGLLCVYVMFLIALASIATAVLLAIGPLFVALWLFDSTRRFFEAWIAQLANYALVTILTVLVAALLLSVMQSYAVQTASRGASTRLVDVLDMLLMCGLVLLVMRQVLPIAAALAGGFALTSMNAVSRATRAPFAAPGRAARAVLTTAEVVRLVSSVNDGNKGKTRTAGTGISNAADSRGS